MTTTTNTTTTTKKAARACCGDDCCPPASPAPAPDDRAGKAAAGDDIREQVRAGYSKIAEAGSWSAAQSDPAAIKAAGCCGAPTGRVGAGGGGCCGPATFTPDELAKAIGYSQAELGATPQGANMGLSCGNPTALASLREGEVVLDLGAGGGFDCFIAGPKVGATGRVIGVDMTPAMLSKARKNIAAYTAQTGLTNVGFRLGEIENIPVADSFGPLTKFTRARGSRLDVQIGST